MTMANATGMLVSAICGRPISSLDKLVCLSPIGEPGALEQGSTPRGTAVPNTAG